MLDSKGRLTQLGHMSKIAESWCPVRDKNVIEINSLTEGSSSEKEFEHRSIIQDLLVRSPNRRKFFKTLGIASAMAGAAAAVEGTARAQSSSFTDFDILNFALNLEYLEAEFYTVATTGQTLSQIGMTVTGSGASGATTGGSQVALTGATLRSRRKSPRTSKPTSSSSSPRSPLSAVLPSPNRQLT